MITRKIAPALAAGCSVVVKPAEATPLTALALAELGARAGLPAGVLNVVTGDRDDAAAIGAELSANATVRCLSFTGSTAVGKHADGAVRADGEARLSRARRQRAVPGLRRRRPRRRRRGRRALEVPQQRTDLRVRQSHPGAGRHPRSLRRGARGARARDEGGPRHRSGRRDRAARERRGLREGRAPRRRRDGSRRAARARRSVRTRSAAPSTSPRCSPASRSTWR